MIALLLVLGCQHDDPETAGSDTDLRGPADVLEIPDVSGLDFTQAYADAMRVAIQINTQQPWLGHTTTLATWESGCPDLWVGPPDVDNMGIPEDGAGLSWYDTCVQSTGDAWDGFNYWETSSSVTGEPSAPEGVTTEAARTLIGDASVKDASGGLVYSFDGEASDAIYDVEGAGYSHWTYSSTVTGNVEGVDSFLAGGSTPGGYRSDLYLYQTGGDIDHFEARGDLYLFNDILSGRFDSISVDMTLLGAKGAGPDDCTLEPYGWIGLRDTNAYWYDLVYLPTEVENAQSTYPNDPLSVCDGCGTLYIRGVEQGQICDVDLSFLFTEGITRPPVSDFVLPLHTLP
jgi:hypothetical protein